MSHVKPRPPSELHPPPQPGDTFYAAVAPRLCTVPLAAEHVLASLLDAEVANNDARPMNADTMTPFHALEAPTISVADYVARLSQYAFSSTACLLAAYNYVRRAAAAQPSLAPTSLSVHRLLITAVVIAAKYFDDVTYSMGYYAKVGGLPAKELVFLELRMLSLLGFKLHVSPADFHTLEVDLATAVRYTPRSATSNLARDSLAASRIAAERGRYCEALHDSDPVGLWRPHPTPGRPMLASMEALSSPCTSPTGSPRRDEAPTTTVAGATIAEKRMYAQAPRGGHAGRQPKSVPQAVRAQAGTRVVARRGRYLDEDERRQSRFESHVSSDHWSR